MMSSAFSSDGYWRSRTHLRDSELVANESIRKLLEDDSYKLMQSAAAEKLKNKRVNCQKPMTEAEAMKYILTQKDEILKSARVAQQFANRPSLLILTKRMMSIQERNLEALEQLREFINRERAKFTDDDYLKAAAKEYAKSMNDGCKMCGDEENLIARRQELVTKLGLARDFSCKPNASGPPEVVILFEDHTEQEQGFRATAKRGIVEHVTQGSDESILLLTEAMSSNAPAIDQARFLDFFKIPVSKQNLNQNGIPASKDHRLQGLDKDTLAAVRSLQIALEEVEKVEIKSGGLKTKNERDGFFSLIIGNLKTRELLQKLALYGASDTYEPSAITIGKTGVIKKMDSFPKIFGDNPRIPMDDDLNKIWKNPQYALYRQNISQLADAFMGSVGSVENGVSVFGNKSLWKSDLKTISAGAPSSNRTDKFDDISFYFLMRTLFYMTMNEVPEITTPETAGGLLRDWAFVENIESAICHAQQSDRKIKKIVVNMGYAHASRVADILRKDAFVSAKNLRLLNAGAYTQADIMKGIHSNVDHTDVLKKLEDTTYSYKDACNYFVPASRLGGGAGQGNSSTSPPTTR